MLTTSVLGWLLLGVLVFWAVGAYNRLVRLRSAAVQSYGALDVLKRQGQVQDSNLTLVRVPGAVEIPLAAKKLAKSGQYDAIVALGTVIRGGTYHFELVASENGKGLAQVMMEYDIPVAFGVLTTENIEQAIERAGTKAGNKGAEAALSALEMINVLKQLDV